IDVYGEQRLLKEGLLPPALVFGHAGYLRPCRGARHAGDVMLHFYAADLARSPDGHWWVIGDRTQAPSGAGYALENRIIISRAFPQLFRDLEVLHLEVAEELRKGARDDDAVLERVACARGRLGAVADHPPVAVGRAREIGGVKVQHDVAGVLGAAARAQVARMAEHQRRRQQGFVE